MGSLTTPLDQALSSRSKVRLLRVLIQQHRTVSARELARVTSMSRPAILAAIADLAQLGLITRESSGRQFLCRVNPAHKLVSSILQPLFAAEAEWPGLLMAGLRSLVTPDSAHAVVAAWVYGSVAEGTDEPGSDLDLFVLTRTDADRTAVADHIADAGAAWTQQFGTEVKPVVMTIESAQAQLAAGSLFIQEALRQARLIVGEIPRELRRG
jgi:DNA-binding transcriptional ArsR family regulator